MPYIVDSSKPSQVICPVCEGYGCNENNGGQNNEPEDRCARVSHRDWKCWTCRTCSGLGWVAAPLKFVQDGLSLRTQRARPKNHN